jgi:hypothetical protein
LSRPASPGFWAKTKVGDGHDRRNGLRRGGGGVGAFDRGSRPASRALGPKTLAKLVARAGSSDQRRRVFCAEAQLSKNYARASGGIPQIEASGTSLEEAKMKLSAETKKLDLYNA